MPAGDSISQRRDFFSVAGELALLPPDVLDELSREATARQALPAQLALQKGLLEATQIDIVETLLRPTEAVPGYEILGVLGRGGMGVVYRARQLNLNRLVALKTVLLNQMGHKTALDRFEQEAQVVARLAHPHIVAAYDFGRHEGRLYFAMELVTGEDVHDLIHRRGPLDERTVWGIIRQAAAGLAHAAQQGIVHRDIKPANLLLVDAPTGFPLPAGLKMVKIADFGLAQLAAPTDERTRLTSADVTVGSPNYMSPEQLMGDPVDLRTDIFALGASAFHMLTGRPPQSGKPLTQILAHRMSGQVESIRAMRANVSYDSVKLVESMMAREPEQRLADYRELTRRIDALDLADRGSAATIEFSPSAMEFSGADTDAATRSMPALPAVTHRVRRPWLVVAAVALAAALVVLAIAFNGRSPAARDLTPSGRMQELFNGQNMSPWRPLSGAWSIARNQENALVLQGQGLVRRSIAVRNEDGGALPPAHYRLLMVVDLHDASAVEVQFDLPDDGRNEPSRFLRLDGTNSSLGARRNGTSSKIAVRPLDKTIAGLHSVEIERQSSDWWVLVDGEILGTADFGNQSPLPEFRLLAEGGPAWFSDVTFEELEPPKPR